MNKMMAAWPHCHKTRLSTSPSIRWCEGYTSTNSIYTHFVVACLTLCSFFLCSFHSLVNAGQPLAPHHNLQITIQPEDHSLSAEDTITFQRPTSIPAILELTLNQTFIIDEIQLNNSVIQPLNIHEEPSTLKDGHRLLIPLSASFSQSSAPSITVRYHGKVADQPKGTPGLRFTRPDHTTGYIGPEGVYLTSETQWYPTISNTLATFQVQSTVPLGWETITQGKETSHSSSRSHTTAVWSVSTPTVALTMAANRFVRKERIWNGITLATYLFPEDARLADQYLEATAKYLDLYTKLLGPYPFSKFAVVENFFPSGIGLPSYTLLGNRIIKRGYTQPYSLGHEIVHSWFGNSVFNDFSTGNWVEGLTTYLSNYYYEELNSPVTTALKKRQQIFFEYNLYAKEPQEYPIKQFHHKESRIDNAIGYQKTAMLFHMLRQEVGDTNFFTSIRTLVSQSTGSYADWNTIQQIFNKTTGTDLNWFFQQWVEWPGSPTLLLETTKVQVDTHHREHFTVDLTLVQKKPHYRLRLPVVLHLADGTIYDTIIRMHDQKQTIRISTPDRPTRLVIDPEFMVLRRLDRSQIPPMLNTWATDPKQSILLEEESSEEQRNAYEPILHRLRSQNSNSIPTLTTLPSLPNRSLLILSNPLKSELAQQGLAGCENVVDIGDTWIKIRGETFEGSDIAWLVSCPHPHDANHVVSLFYGFSPSSISRVARLLFFYGWDSYLVFKDGRVISRGVFAPLHNPLDILLHTT